MLENQSFNQVNYLYDLANNPIADFSRYQTNEIKIQLHKFYWVTIRYSEKSPMAKKSILTAYKHYLVYCYVWGIPCSKFQPNYKEKINLNFKKISKKLISDICNDCDTSGRNYKEKLNLANNILNYLCAISKEFEGFNESDFEIAKKESKEIIKNFNDNLDKIFFDESIIDCIENSLFNN